MIWTDSRKRTRRRNEEQIEQRNMKKSLKKGKKRHEKERKRQFIHSEEKNNISLGFKSNVEISGCT